MIGFLAPGKVHSVRLLPALSLFLLALLSGCASTPQSDALAKQWQDSGQASMELSDVPFFPQQRYQCGPAALATTLNYNGIAVAPDELVDMVYVPEKQGSFQVELLAATRRLGGIPYVIDPDLENLAREIESGKPVLVMQNLGIKWLPQWHYAVAVGMDTEDENIILRSGELKRRITPLDVFENTWARSQHWGFVVVTPGEIPVTAEENRYFLAVSEFAKQADARVAETALVAGVKRWPESKPLNMALANLYYSQGNLGLAEKYYRYLTESYPDFAPAHNNLANLLLATGDISGARTHAKTAVELGGRFVSSYQATLDDINRYGERRP